MRLPTSIVALLFGLAMHQSAVARPFYVEGPALSTRSEATSLAQMVHSAGYRPRVVRRYGHGVGWSFTVVLDGYAGKDQATEVAALVSDLTGRSHAVFVERGQPDPQTHVTAASTARTPEPMSSAALLHRARSVHGGGGSLDRLAKLDDLTFRFVRETQDGRTVLHTYARRADSRYLRIEVLEGEGVNSELRLAGDLAWLRRGDSGWVQQNKARSKEIVESFSPEQVLHSSLVLADALSTRRELALMQISLVTPQTVQMRYDGVGKAASMWLDSNTGRIVRLELGSGEERITRELQGDAASLVVTVPERLITRRGDQVLDDVRVMLLEATATAPEAWFAAPDDRLE